MTRKASRINLIIVIGFVLIIGITLGIAYDYYYDLNDDVLMKDILSGAYLGKPSGYNIQMLWPISTLISLFYRITDGIAWYGLFLLVIQFGSLIIIALRLHKLTDKIKGRAVKYVFAISALVLTMSIMLSHLVNVQYTISVAMLSAAAISIIMTTDDKANAKQFIIDNIPTIIILFIAYLLRTEMLLLMLPFVGAAVIYKLSADNRLFTIENIIKLISLLLIIAGMLAIGEGASRMAYGSNEWRTFTDLFNARTELYDFQVPPEYEGNEEFYTSIGLSEEEAILFQNYNYGIDSKINNDVMWKTAEYANTLKKADTSAQDKLLDNIRLYVYEISHVWKGAVGSDYPWNIVAIILYAGCLFTLIINKDYISIWKIAALFMGRSAIWLYILMGERTPDRITHSLYFIEIILLIFLLGQFITKSSIDGFKKIITTIFTTLFILLSILILPDNMKQLKFDQNMRKDVNAPFNDLYQYMENNQDKLYLLDTYSTVSYSEKIFGDVSVFDKSNSNTLGGWATFSPIENDKLRLKGFNNIESAMLSDNVYFVKDKDVDMTWLSDYYESNGKSVTVNIVDTISDRFEVWSVR